MVSEHETKSERLDKTSLLEFIDQGINKNTRTKTERDARPFFWTILNQEGKQGR